LMRTVLCFRGGVDRITVIGVDHNKAMEAREVRGLTDTKVAIAQRIQQAFGMPPKPTPLYEDNEINKDISEVIKRDVRISFKDESHSFEEEGLDEHHVGAFKWRAIVETFVRVLSGNIPKNVIAVSTGNHGLATVEAVRAIKMKLKDEGVGFFRELYSQLADEFPEIFNGEPLGGLTDKDFEQKINDMVGVVYADKVDDMPCVTKLLGIKHQRGKAKSCCSLNCFSMRFFKRHCID